MTDEEIKIKLVQFDGMNPIEKETHIKWCWAELSRLQAVERAARELPLWTPENRKDKMQKIDPLWHGKDPLYGDAPEWIPVAVLVDSEKLVAVRRAIESDALRAALGEER